MGSKLITIKTKDRLLAKYTNQCLSTSNVNNLINDIGNLYLESGFVTSRAFIQEQDLSDGELDITIIEGKVAKIIVKPATNSKNLIKAVFPKVPGRYLNLRDIEMGVEQINRLKSHTAKSSLLPAKTPGQTDIVVNIKRTKPIHFSTTIDNKGSEGTGKHLANSSLVVDNPFGRSDRFTIGFNGTIQ